MKKQTKIIIIAIILLIMFIPMIIEMYNNRLQKMSYDSFKEIIEKKEDALVYFDSDKSSVKRSMLKNINIIDENSELKTGYFDYDAVTETEKIELVNINNQILDGPAFAFIRKGEIIDVRNGAFTEIDLIKLFGKYFSDGTEEINYKVAGSAAEFIDVAAKEKPVMVVLGRTSAQELMEYKSIYNELALKYDIDIYEFDSDYYDDGEYGKLMNKNYKIPGLSSSMKDNKGKNLTCTKDGKDGKISSAVGEILTLLIKNGEVIDCISVPVEKATLISVFQFNKIAVKK